LVGLFRSIGGAGGGDGGGVASNEARVFKSEVNEASYHTNSPTLVCGLPLPCPKLSASSPRTGAHR
jgi:hypothetical protein